MAVHTSGPISVFINRNSICTKQARQFGENRIILGIIGSARYPSVACVRTCACMCVCVCVRNLEPRARFTRQVQYVAREEFRRRYFAA